MEYIEFAKRVEYLHDNGKLWAAFTSGISHANTHIGQDPYDMLQNVIINGKDAHSTYSSEEKANEAIYYLLTNGTNMKKLYNFSQYSAVGTRMQITLENSNVIGVGILHDENGNLKTVASPSMQAVFFCKR